MSRKKTTSKELSENAALVLPSDNEKMKEFILNNKFQLTEHTISSIEFAVKNQLPFIEVFKFDKSEFVITIEKKDYITNIDHIYNFYLENEKYELCDRVVRLQRVLKYNSNEKEIEFNKITE